MPTLKSIAYTSGTCYHRHQLVLLINHLADPPVTTSLGLVKIQNFARLYSFYVKVGLWLVTVRKVQNGLLSLRGRMNYLSTKDVYFRETELSFQSEGERLS